MTIATAIVFSHRFFLRQSHAKNDRRVCLLMLLYCVFLICMPYCIGFTLLFQVPWLLCFFDGVSIFVFIKSSAYVRLVLIFILFSVVSFWKVLILVAHQFFFIHKTLFLLQKGSLYVLYNAWMLWNFHILFRSHFFFITCQFFY